jgi:hypothetical protein
MLSKFLSNNKRTKTEANIYTVHFKCLISRGKEI